MLTNKMKQEHHQVLLDKNSDYEGVFYVGVKTTGVFCRPVCPVRKQRLLDHEKSIADLLSIADRKSLARKHRPLQLINKSKC